MTETDKSFRISKTSSSGHTRIRPVGRQRKKEFYLTWGSMSGSDKATLEDFFNENSVLEFLWTHPLTSVVYTVYFNDDELSFKHVKNFSNRWSVSITLGEA